MYAKPVAGRPGTFVSPAPATRRLVHSVTVSTGDRVLLKLIEADDVYVARVSCATARQLGIVQKPRDLLGGIGCTGSGFAPVVYTDRDHLLYGTGPVERLDDVKTLAEAAESLIRYRQTH